MHVVIKIKDLCPDGDLWLDRDAAHIIKEEIVNRFNKGNRSSVMLQDFSGITQITFSAVSEVIGGCIRDGISVIITGLTELMEEGIDISLRHPREELCCFAINGLEMNDLDWKLLGTYSKADLETLDQVIRFGKVETSELSKALNISVPSCNNRLKSLQRLGLVRRQEEIAPTGGKQYKYFSSLSEIVFTKNCNDGKL